MEVALYIKEDDTYNPLGAFARGLIETYGLDVKIENSKFNWTSMGDLPVLRCGTYLFPCTSIFEALQKITTIDEGLSEEGKSHFKMLQEICFSRLHPATLYAMWFSPMANKYFSAPFGSLSYRFYSKLLNPIRRYKIRNYLNYQHNLQTPEEAYRIANDAHKLLSESLLQGPLFSSKHAKNDRPHSIDFLIWAYLYEEKCNLAGHPHVADSLNNFENLNKFMTIMEECMKAKICKGTVGLVNWEDLETRNWMKAHSFQSSFKAEVVEKYEDTIGRRNYVSMCAAGILAYILINN